MMVNKKYKVNRSDIYVGELISTDSIYRSEIEDDLFDIKKGHLYTSCWTTYRSMLFVLTEEKLSEDLLYNSLHYPILNVTDNDICLGFGNKESQVIKDAYNLSLLLEYFGYKEELTYEDIVKIRKTFFTGRFGMDNCKLFGMEEIIPSDFEPKMDGILVTDENEIYELYKKSVTLGSQRKFGSISSYVLPPKLMNILDEMGSTYDGRNPFVPSKAEQNVKKLTRF